MSIDDEIADFSVALLLRYFHSGRAGVVAPHRLQIARDLEILLGYWAVSDCVRAFVEHLRHNPNELESVLTPRLTVVSSVVRGRILARQTQLHRIRTGNPSVLLTHQPDRIVDVELNRLVAWVLERIGRHQFEMLAWQSRDSPFRGLLEEAANELAAVTRTGPAAALLQTVRTKARRPTSALRGASRSRRTVYRLAGTAYQLLLDIETGDAEALARVLGESVVGPLETWRRWELAVGLALGEALATITSSPLELRVLAGNTETPVLKVGVYDIYWQRRTNFAHSYSPEPSELRTSAALADYGLAPGSDRPDLVIVDRSSATVVSLIEAKYSSGDSAESRLREAVSQVVRYSRSYGDAESQKALVSNSIVALSSGAPRRQSTTAPAPTVIDFLDFKRPQALLGWAEELVRLS